jgi:translation elongation factor EF-Ts
VALQIAAAAPVYVRDENIPAALLAEMERSAGKPEALVTRIVEGTLANFKERHVLLHQPSMRDETHSMAARLNQVSALAGENSVINCFVRC